MDYNPINNNDEPTPSAPPPIGYQASSQKQPENYLPSLAPSAPLFDDKQVLLSNQDAPECRCCLRSQADWDFIRPCPCASVVHRACLDKWRAVSPNPNSMTRCDVCDSQYEFEADSSEEKNEKCCSPMARFGVAVTRDVFIILSLCVGLVLLSGLVILPAADSDYWRNQW